MSQVLEAFVRECDRLDSTVQPDEDVIRATENFSTAVAENPVLLRELAHALPQRQPGPAAWAAMTLGTAVERGADPELAGPALLDYFVNYLALLPREDEDPTDEQSDRLDAFLDLCRAVVSHLSRLPKEQARLSQDRDLMVRWKI